MVDLTQDAQNKLTGFMTELPQLMGMANFGMSLPALNDLRGKLVDGQGIDPAVRDQIVTSFNANPDAAIASMRKKVKEDPNIIAKADADPNKILPQLLGTMNSTQPALVAEEVNPAGLVNPPGSQQPETKVVTAQPVTVPATPEQKADFYLKTQLDPALKAYEEKVPENQRQSNAQLQEWRTSVRDAIIGYERVEVTPDKAAEVMRQNGAKPAEMDLFFKQVAESKAKGLTPEQQAIEGYKAVDISRHAMPNHDKKNPNQKEFLGNEDIVGAMFRSRIYQSETHTLSDEQVAQMGRNASVVDLLTGSAAPRMGMPNYNMVRAYVDEKTRVPADPAAKPVTADPKKTTEVTQPQNTAVASATSVLDTVVSTIGSIFVTPAHAEELPANPVTTVNANDTAKPVTKTAMDDRVAHHAQLVGEIAVMGMEMSQKPGIKKLYDAAQKDQDMALAIKNMTGIDVHQDLAAATKELQGMSTEDLEAKKASMARMNSMIGTIDPMLDRMSPQAFNSLSTLINGGSQLMNMDGNSTLGGLSSMFSGGNFDISKLMSGFQGMGGIGDMLKSLMTAFTTFMGEMFGGFGSSGQLFGASNSGGQLTGDMAEIAKLQPGLNGKSPTVVAYYDDKGKPAVDPLSRPKLATDATPADPARKQDVTVAQPG